MICFPESLQRLLSSLLKITQLFSSKELNVHTAVKYPVALSGTDDYAKDGGPGECPTFV